MQSDCPAALDAAQLGERADPRASGREQDSTMPSTAAPRALPPLPVSGRSETRAVTRPESDGAAGPIARGSGSRGGGAEAGRGAVQGGELREAQPRRGPAGGGEVAGPGGARQRAGPEVGEFIPRGFRARGPRGWLL